MNADEMYARLAPVATYDAENGGVVAAIADVLAASQELVDDIARDRPDDGLLAWQAALDPDHAPAELLPWLAQFPGVKLLPSDTEAQQRDRIKQAAGFYRGTIRAIREETERELTGTRTVKVLTHVSGNRWLMTVITRTSETPDAATAERAARRQKPAGVLLTFTVSSDPVIDEAAATRTIDAIGSAGTTIDAITLADWT